MRLSQNFSFATATAEERGFAARRAKNRKSLRKTNRVLRQALMSVLFSSLLLHEPAHQRAAYDPFPISLV
jgi:hypothetical protein